MKQITLQFDKTPTYDLMTFMKRVYNMIKEEVPNGKWELVIRKPIRTSKQNRALHVWFNIIAEALNEAGWYKVVTLKGTNIELESLWTDNKVKEDIWRPFQQALYQKTSTTQLTTQELTKVSEALIDSFSKRGLILTFPSMEAIMNDFNSYEIIK